MTRRSSTPAYYAKRTSAGKPRPIAKGIAPKTAGERMNKTEQRFALTLESELAAGHCIAWWFEAMSWRLADNTHYRPDFQVQRPDGSIELYEVKAAKRGEYMTTPEAWVKLKVAAEQMPYPLTVVWQTKDGYWQRERLN
jgi:hypothetical protein